MVFNVTFNNISVILQWSVLLVEENGVLGENQNNKVTEKFRKNVMYVEMCIMYYVGHSMIPPQ